ncbi:MAG TPA: helix-turn-helix domain-containing protein [Herpetosiphonaceae bacterium]|nr:helix-turn-helix domain-containing protein [Herpetosiphonaceae bacterium]
MTEEYITASEAARLAGVTRARIYELARGGRLGRQEYGRVWIFTRAEVEAYRAQAAERPRGGRPKDEAGTQTPAIPA